MSQAVSRQGVPDRRKVPRRRLWRHRAARSEQHMPAAGQFERLRNLFLYLLGRAVLERAFLADTAHHRLARPLLALAQIWIALKRGAPANCLHRVCSKLVEVDVRATVVQNSKLAAALDAIQKLQVVLLPELAVLIGSQQALAGPAVRGVKDAGGPFFHAGNGEGCEGLGNHAQRGMHRGTVLADRLEHRLIPVADKIFSDAQRTEDSLYEVGIVANFMIDEL